MDYVWPRRSGRRFYHLTLDEVLRLASDPVDLPAAVVFYLAYIAARWRWRSGRRRNDPLIQTTVFGAIPGAMCYAT